MTPVEQIRSLLNRLARLDAVETWEGDLNPAQTAGLVYLSRANRFSRAPSHVADYLGTTRGTASQTLKALLRKGYLVETPSLTDKRSISYDPTDKGRAVAARSEGISTAIGTLANDEQTALADGLAAILAAKVAENGGRTFGVCKTCRYHTVDSKGAFCDLLSVPLKAQEPDQICHEHVSQA